MGRWEGGYRNLSTKPHFAPVSFSSGPYCLSIYYVGHTQPLSFSKTATSAYPTPSTGLAPCGHSGTQALIQEVLLKLEGAPRGPNSYCCKGQSSWLEQHPSLESWLCEWRLEAAGQVPSRPLFSQFGKEVAEDPLRGVQPWGTLMETPEWRRPGLLM